MNTSVGMKAKKKQYSLSDSLPAKSAVSPSDRALEQLLLPLENACLRVLETQFVRSRADAERRCWQQRFTNIASAVSLALAECKGPRHFHYHYRHREDDDSVLHPVLENPFDTLAQQCRTALRASYTELVGLEDNDLVELRDMLETALDGFLREYEGA